MPLMSFTFPGFPKTFLTFHAKVSGIVQESVSLMAVFAEKLLSFFPDFPTTDCTFSRASVRPKLQYQDSLCPGLVLQKAAYPVAQMQRGIISAFYHGHFRKVLAVVRKHNDSGAFLNAEIHDFPAHLMAIMPGKILKVLKVFFIRLLDVILIRINTGTIDFFHNLPAAMTVFVSSAAGV